MIGILRAAILGFIILSVAYVLISIYSRSVRREKLEKKFDAGGIEGDRESYIRGGMQTYEKGLRRRLLWLVYIIPAVVVTATVYFVNYQ
ncbi:MAG: hypothetical protein JWS10_2220 [Cypionkella sp.]|uniref:hypothetical protein n=1 Tax=Cypionkella sp. TaxID=2811411 RepID=UPI002623AA25|nr:hypothetical protein [Cypionkella sp.]MDB5659605.1 hypothetical protein [Cypionkella sp.]MDB5665360.1 hypothetical protein [Cypionkella sp.]